MKRRVGIGMVAGTLWGLSLAFGCAQTAYQTCPDEATLCAQLFALRNDLLRGTYYCGSDDAWHYFSVKRQIGFFVFEDGLKAPAAVNLPFPLQPKSEEPDAWLAIDGHLTEWMAEADKGGHK